MQSALSTLQPPSTDLITLYAYMIAHIKIYVPNIVEIGLADNITTMQFSTRNYSVKLIHAFID